MKIESLERERKSLREGNRLKMRRNRDNNKGSLDSQPITNLHVAKKRRIIIY